MTDSTPSADHRGATQQPGVLLLAVLGSVGLLLIFFICWLVVAIGGTNVLPAMQHDPEPYSYIAPPAASAFDA